MKVVERQLQSGKIAIKGRGCLWNPMKLAVETRDKRVGMARWLYDVDFQIDSGTGSR